MADDTPPGVNRTYIPGRKPNAEERVRLFEAIADQYGRAQEARRGKRRGGRKPRR